MESFDRKTHWEKAWRSKRADETSWHQAVPDLSLSMIRNSGLDPEEPLIDVGGGASPLVDHLLDRGFHDLTVLDISAAAIAQTRKRLGNRAKRVNWIESDITAFEPGRCYRFWHDRAVFHFLTSTADRQRYVEVLQRALAPGGHAVIATFAPGGPLKCSGLDIVQYDAAGLQAELVGGLALREQQIEMHRTPAGNEQKFGFYRFERVD